MPELTKTHDAAQWAVEQFLCAVRPLGLVAAGHFHEDDQIVATRGFYIDVTEAVAADIQEAIGEELGAIIADREVIEQAKGMLMALYYFDADAAFAVLRWRSQELNLKLHTVAARLVSELPSLLQIAPRDRSRADHYLMTLNAPDK